MNLPFVTRLQRQQLPQTSQASTRPDQSLTAPTDVSQTWDYTAASPIGIVVF